MVNRSMAQVPAVRAARTTARSARIPRSDRVEWNDIRTPRNAPHPLCPESNYRIIPQGIANDENTPETWEKSFQVDMMHTVNTVTAALPYLEKSSAASIVIIASVSGFEVDFAAGSYGATKAALIHYAKGLSNQLIGKGIRVNAVSPGNTYFEGGIWQNIERGMPDLYKTAMSLNPTGRMGTPQEVAAGVVFLASPVASRISGTNLIVDGALTKAV